MKIIIHFAVYGFVLGLGALWIALGKPFGIGWFWSVLVGWATSDIATKLCKLYELTRERC